MLDKLSLLASLWPIFLALFFATYGIFALTNGFFSWCFKAKWCVKEKTCYDFSDWKDIQKLEVKTGDIIVFGFQGMSRLQEKRYKDGMRPFLKGCVIFPVYDCQGFKAIITPVMQKSDEPPQAQNLSM